MSKLKKFLVEKGWLAADASEADVKSAAAARLKSGELSLDEYTDLVAGEQPAKSKADELSDAIASKVAAGMSGQFDKLIAALTPKAAPITQTAGDSSNVDDLAKDADEAAKAYAASRQSTQADGKATPADVFKAAADASKGGNIRVKKASERYDNTTKSVTCHRGPFKDMPAMVFEGDLNTEGHAPVGKTVNELSEAQYAKLGAIFLRKSLNAIGDYRPLPEHIDALLKESVNEDKFVGLSTQKSSSGRRLNALEIKTVLDDSTSGGEEAVPEYFDYAAIVTPLLHSELFPWVQLVRVPRGSAASGYAIGTPTFVSTASGTGVVPFTTTSFVSAFDTSFFPATCAIEFGLDFLEDAAPQFGQLVMNQINQEHLRWLDEQIAIGDGTTEPQGIFTASGTVVPPESTHTFSSFTYNDYVNVAFGIDKAHRLNFGGNATRYVMNDSQYKKAMQIVTGVTGDTRPIFGMHLKDYMLGDYGVSIQNGISNGNFALCNLRGYRLYQRQGIQFLTDDTGRTNRLANTKLILARTRWGGKITRTQYIAELTA